jgi:hypothetical protein
MGSSKVRITSTRSYWPRPSCEKRQPTCGLALVVETGFPICEIIELAGDFLIDFTFPFFELCNFPKDAVLVSGERRVQREIIEPYVHDHFRFLFVEVPVVLPR